MILQVSFVMLYNLNIDIVVSHLFLILCCSVYMVISVKLKLNNAWCFIAVLYYLYQKLPQCPAYTPPVLQP